MLVHGDRHAFIVQAPEGWVPASVSGIPAAFNRKQETWASGRAVMYVSTATVDSGDAKPPEQVIREDSARFAEGSPLLRLEVLPPIKTLDGRDALLRRFLGGQTGNVEVVAYVRERTVTPIIVLSARSPADYDRALTPFYALVRSYEFITSDIMAGDSLPCGITRE